MGNIYKGRKTIFAKTRIGYKSIRKPKKLNKIIDTIKMLKNYVILNKKSKRGENGVLDAAITRECAIKEHPIIIQQKRTN